MIEVDADRRGLLGIVRDQGPNPTCLSHATSTAHEARRGNPRPLSAEYLHHQANGGDFGTGATIPNVKKALLGKGQPAQTACSLFIQGRLWLPPENVVLYRGSTSAIAAARGLISAVRAGWHPVVCLTITEDFFQPTSPWLITVGGKPVALHAMVAVGVGQAGKKPVLLIRNSWGSDWADEGHVWLDLAYLEAHLFGAFTVEAR